MKLTRTICFILAIVDWRNVDKCGVQSGSCKTCIFYNYDMCFLHFIDFVFCLVIFFANCNDVHFADWNNELLEKEKKTHTFC